MGEPSRRGFAVALGIIALVAFGVRLAYVLAGPHIELGIDSVWYMLASGPIADGQGYLNPGRLYGDGVVVATAAWPPLFPTFLAAVTKLATGTETAFQVAGCVMGSGTVVLTGVLGRQLGDRLVGLCAAALAAGYPLLIAVDGSVMTETVYVPLVLAAVVVAVSAVRRPTVWRYVLLGALLGAAALTRGDAVILAPLLLLGTVLGGRLAARSEPWTAWLARAGVAVVVLLAVTVPWAVRNEARVGEAALVAGNGGGTIGGANCPSTYAGELLGSWDIRCLRVDARLAEVELIGRQRSDGIDYALDHKGRWPVVVSARVLRVWGLYDPLDQARLEALESRNRPWQIVGWAVYLAVAVLALRGLWLLWRGGGRAALLPVAAVLTSVTATAVATHGNQRFRSTAEPLLLVAAAVTIVAAGRALRRWSATR